MSQANKPRAVRRQLFPEKLWELVNMQGSGISWSQDGKRVEVERRQLEKFIGSKFRSHNFNSFIRQLHFYGFRKSGNSYHHDQFQRDHPEMLRDMKRKYSKLPPPIYMSGGGSNASSNQCSNDNMEAKPMVPYNNTTNNNDSNNNGQNSVENNNSNPNSSINNMSLVPRAHSNNNRCHYNINNNNMVMNNMVQPSVNESPLDLSYDDHYIDADTAQFYITQFILRDFNQLILNLMESIAPSTSA